MKKIAWFCSAVGWVLGMNINGILINPLMAQSLLLTAVQPQPTPANAEDLKLFLRAFRDFGQDNAAKTTSQLSLRATTQGTTVETVATIQAIVQKPNQFRVDIAFGPERDASKKHYQVICDGKTVWIYRPDTQEYAVQTHAEFERSDDSFLLGATSNLFLSLPSDLNTSLSDENLAMIASNPTLVASLYKDMKTQFKGYQKDAAGKNFAVYAMGEAKSPYQVNLWVDPQTISIQQLQISGQDKGLTFSLQDVIVDRITNPKTELNTFRFIAPQGTKRLKTLSISPFGD